ncbi:MAG: ABC transporter permease [Actinomycetota bacterium]
MKQWRAQIIAELRLLARNGEQLLLTMGIPVLLLVFFSVVDVLPTGEGDAIDFLLPGVLAIALMSTAMVSLGIATGFERSYGVLKRLGATPLGRPRLIAAKLACVVVVQVVQFVLLAVIAAVLGWSMSGLNVIALLSGFIFGTASFVGIGLFLAGTLRGEINLAAQNGLYLLMLLLSGMIIDADSMPSGLSSLATALPSGALASIMRTATGHSTSGIAAPTMVLIAWSAIALVLAGRTFSWSPTDSKR